MLIAVLLVGPLLSAIPIIVWVFRRRTRAALEALQVHAFVLAAWLAMSCIVDLSRSPTGVDLSGAFQFYLILTIVADLAVYVAVGWRKRTRGESGSPVPSVFLALTATILVAVAIAFMATDLPGRVRDAATERAKGRSFCLFANHRPVDPDTIALSDLVARKGDLPQWGILATLIVPAEGGGQATALSLHKGSFVPISGRSRRRHQADQCEADCAARHGPS